MDKPKLLYIAPQNPYPPENGGKIGTYNITNCNVDISIEHFNKLNIKYFPFMLNTDDKLFDLLLNPFNKIPFKWYKYHSDDLYNFCKNLISTENINFVYTSTPHMSYYSLLLKNHFPNLKIFLREHNIEFSLVEQFLIFSRNPIHKIIAKWQLKKSKKMELKYWELFDKIFFISDSDYNIAIKYRPNLKQKFHILYDGFEISPNTLGVYNPENKFIITANLKSPQNKICIKWFIENIWLPSLEYLKKNNFGLSITGCTINEFENLLNLGNLEQYNINILGFVNNIDEVIRKHKYVISPTIMGSGLRIKILHSMSLSKVIFATSYDINSVNVLKDMENIIEFNDYNSFIEKLKIIENNLDLYQKIENNALNTVTKNFNWEIYAKIIYNQFLNN